MHGDPLNHRLRLPVGAVYNRTASALLETAPTKSRRFIPINRDLECLINSKIQYMPLVAGW